MDENVFLVSLFEHKAWCNRRLLETLRAAPADVDRGGWIVVLFTVDHTANVDQIFKARLEDAEPDLPNTVARAMPDLDALAERMAALDAWFIDYARRVTPAELAEPVDFTFVDDAAPGRMTRGDILAHLITHGAAHRGAIGKTLADLGVRGVSEMVTTFRRVEG
jgi:uncharacterized damage-inducible protein DinB